VPGDAAVRGKAEPTYEQIRMVVRRSPINWMDETGWRVAAGLQWLWVCLSAEVTCYDILPGRGFEQASSMLGEDYEGWLHHDGWKVYYQFRNAFHQSQPATGQTSATRTAMAVHLSSLPWPGGRHQQCRRTRDASCGDHA
jgi:hypothetical protein